MHTHAHPRAIKWIFFPGGKGGGWVDPGMVLPQADPDIRRDRNDGRDDGALLCPVPNLGEHWPREIQPGCRRAYKERQSEGITKTPFPPWWGKFRASDVLF